MHPSPVAACVPLGKALAMGRGGATRWILLILGTTTMIAHQKEVAASGGSVRRGGGFAETGLCVASRWKARWRACLRSHSALLEATMPIWRLCAPDLEVVVLSAGARR